MSSSKITQAFCKKNFPSHLINRQLPSLMLKNLRPDLFRSSFLRNFINVKNAKTGHKVKAVILEYSNKKLAKATSIRELVQKKFINTSKELKNPDTRPVQSFATFNIIWGVILNILGIGVLIDILFALVVCKISEYRVNSVLENGTQLKPKVMKDEFISRPQISETLSRVIRPHDGLFYYVIYGEPKTGKTTLIRTEVENIGKGIIYVDIPSDVNNFGKAFGKAFNLSFFEDISFTVRLLRKFFSIFDEASISHYRLKRVMEIFQHASEVYKKNHNGNLPIIIYDNISSQLDPKILHKLQSNAYNNVYNKHKYIAVFVISENSTLKRMESEYYTWRQAEGPVEIGNLNKEESMEYLIKKHKIDEIEAKKLYDLIGGNFAELDNAADHLLAGQSFEDIKKQVLIGVEKRFEIAKFLQNQVGKKVIKALLDSKELGVIKFLELFNNREEGEKVLETNNIFMYHPEKYTVNFRSQSVERYIQENANNISIK